MFAYNANEKEGNPSDNEQSNQPGALIRNVANNIKEAADYDTANSTPKCSVKISNSIKKGETPLNNLHRTNVTTKITFPQFHPVPSNLEMFTPI